MTRSRRIRLVAVAATAGALAAPGAAAAAPVVFATTAKLVPPGLTPTVATLPADLTNEPQYLLSNGGFTYSVRESNAKLDGGILDTAKLPTAYRSVIPTSRWLSEAATGAQPHATCNVASLNDPATVLGWQGAEPAYGYIPFQATSAGLGDDPASWLARVQTATGLALTPATNLATACAGLGGTFVPADTVVTPAAPFAAGLTAPLAARVATLEASIASLTAAKTSADAAKASAEAAKASADDQIKALKLNAATATVKVSSSATLQRGLEVDYAGPPGRKVFVRVVLSEAQRKQLKLRYRTLGRGSDTVAANGKVRVIVEPKPETASVLLTQTTALPVVVQAVSGDRAVNLAVDLGA